MEKSKIIAIVCAVLAALLVMIAGKSCTDSINEANEKARKATESTAEPTYYTYAGNAEDETTEATVPPVTDAFGREVVGATHPIVTTIPEPTTRVEEVTDAFGRVIDTEIITEAVTYPDPVVESTSLNPIEQYNRDKEKPPEHGLSGYNHKQYDENGEEIPTLASDFVIIIG